MAPVFSFPNPINEVSARLIAGGVVVIAVTTLVLDQPWLTAVLAYGFVARVVAGPAFSPLAQLVNRVVIPALHLSPKPVDGPPKRFAQGLGAVVTVTAAVLALGFDQQRAAYVLVAVLLIPAGLEAFANYCVGCKIFGVLARTGLIPESLCADCADLWKGREHLRPPASPDH